MEIPELEIEIIADSLANFHDWMVVDLKSEFIQNLKDNDVQLSEEAMEKIYENFMSIDSTQRYKASFNHKDFTRDQYISLNSL